MASTYSTNLALELIGTGDQAGTWGLTTNTNLGTLIEQAISGYVTQAVATGTDTTITIPNGATGVARNMYIELTGTGGASTNLIVPANKKLYFIFNNTSSGQVTVKVSGQTGVSVPNKAKMILVSNGTDIVDATNYIGNISAASANITTLTSASATITNLLATSATVSSGSTLNGGVVINEPGADVDFRVESDTDTHCLFVDASANNVGIGTSSPVAKFDIVDGANNSTGQLRLTNSGSFGTRMGFVSTSTNGRTYQIGSNFAIGDGEFSIYDATASAERLQISASGNLGLGVTPSAWGSGRTALQIGNTNSYFVGKENTALGNNAFNDGTNWKYLTSGVNAGLYAQLSGGSHAWYTAPSGTAGDPITFTQAMTLDVAGNLLVGATTNPGILNKSVVVDSGSSSLAGYILQNNTTGRTSTDGSALYISGSLLNLYNLENDAMVFGTNNTERARITAAGGFAVGTTTDPGVGNIGLAAGKYLGFSSTAYMTPEDNSIGARVSTPGAFTVWTGATPAERARITSGGDLLVGKTTVGFDAGVSVESIGVVNSSRDGGPSGYFNRNTDDGTIVVFVQAGTEEGSISVSGNTVSYNAFAGSHWSQLQDGSKPDILRGTVMESINELCVWPGEENERLPKAKISDTAGSKKVYGVFMAWDNDWTETNDMYVTAVGAFICRVNGSVTVQEGDLLESNGDGTARVQADDIIRSSTIGKVTSTVKTHQYDDGSYCVPTVLYCG